MLLLLQSKKRPLLACMRASLLRYNNSYHAEMQLWPLHCKIILSWNLTAAVTVALASLITNGVVTKTTAHPPLKFQPIGNFVIKIYVPKHKLWG